MAKGNFLSKARGARQVERLLLRSASHIDRHQCIIRQGVTAGTELSLSGGRFRRKCCGDMAAGTDAQEFI
jgi:hypothetical protein